MNGAWRTGRNSTSTCASTAPPGTSATSRIETGPTESPVDEVRRCEHKIAGDDRRRGDPMAGPEAASSRHPLGAEGRGSAERARRRWQVPVGTGGGPDRTNGLRFKLPWGGGSALRASRFAIAIAERCARSSFADHSSGVSEKASWIRSSKDQPGEIPSISPDLVSRNLGLDGRLSLACSRRPGYDCDPLGDPARNPGRQSECHEPLSASSPRAERT